MSKQYFALRLTPSRPDFAFTMTPEEQEIMNAHIAYLEGFRARGVALVYGPVLDPAGAYGLAIVSVDSEDEVKELIQNDPGAAINTYSYAPMMAAVAGIAG